MIPNHIPNSPPKKEQLQIFTKWKITGVDRFKFTYTRTCWKSTYAVPYNKNFMEVAPWTWGYSSRELGIPKVRLKKNVVRLLKLLLSIKHLERQLFHWNVWWVLWHRDLPFDYLPFATGVGMILATPVVVGTMVLNLLPPRDYSNSHHFFWWSDFTCRDAQSCYLAISEHHLATSSWQLQSETTAQIFDATGWWFFKMRHSHACLEEYASLLCIGTAYYFLWYILISIESLPISTILCSWFWYTPVN